MEENEEYDSDSTVLLTDFADKPQKIDVKRRRLSHLQDRSKQSGQLNEDNAARNDVSQKIQAGSPHEKNRDWRLTNYFSRINEMNDTNLPNNISDFRCNEELMPIRAPDCQNNPGNILKGNTAQFDNEDNIVCLDSDDEIQNDGKTQNINQNVSVNDGINSSKLIVLKPAAINARRATVDCIYDEQTQNIDINADQNSLVNGHINSSKLIVLQPSAINARRATINCVTQRQEGNKPARLRVLKPSIINGQAIINGRRGTSHFEENNLKCSSNNEKKNILKEDNEESEKDKQAEDDCDRIKTPRFSDLQNTISDTRAGCSLSSILPVSSNPLNTILCHNTPSKDLRQDTESNTVSNVKAHKRFGNIESLIEAKRIKPNMKQNILVLPSTVFYTNIEENNENPKVREDEKGKDEEHVHRDERHAESWPAVRRSATLEKNSTYEKEVLNSETFHKECTDKDTNIAHVKHQGSLSSVKQKTSKVQAEEVISEGCDKQRITAILDEPITNRPHYQLETRHAQDCRGTSKVQDEQEASDQHNKNETSKMHEDQDASKGRDTLETSDVRKYAQDNVISALQDQQIVNKFDQHETSLNHDKTVTNEETINGVKNLGDYVENETNKNKDTNKVFNVGEPNPAGVDLVTNKVQDKQVTSNKIFLEATDQEQETTHVQAELETHNNKEKQISNTALEYQETEKLQDKQITSQRLDTEDLRNDQYKDSTSIAPEQETQKVSSEQITCESKSCNEQETDQQNISITGSINAYVVDSECMLKFQRWFFTKIIENLNEMQNSITEKNPESAIMLTKFIETLVDARNSTDQTDVEYNCPKCGCVSNYSSSLLDNRESDENNPNPKNCGLCCYIRKIHTTYLKRYLNKKNRNVNNKEAVTLGEKDLGSQHSQPAEQFKSSKPAIDSRHSKTIPKENTCNALVSSPKAMGSISNLNVQNEKRIDNLTFFSSSDTKRVNHNVTKDYKIVNEDPCVDTSTRDIFSPSDNNNSEINLVSKEKNTTSGTLKELSDQDISITQNNKITGEITLMGSHVNEVITILNKLTIHNKRTNTEEQAINHKRMKTSAENYVSHNDQNVKTKDISLYSTTVPLSEFSVIENNKKRYQSARGNSNSGDELPKNILRGKQSETSVTPVISPVVVGSHNNGDCNSAENSDTAEKTSNESLSETHTNTTNTNTQLSLQSKSDNISIVQTDKLISMSDNKGNEVTNEKTTDLCSQKVCSVKVKENYNSIIKACDKSGKETIMESNVSKTDSQIRNTVEMNKDNESTSNSMVDCFTQIKNTTKEGQDNHVKRQAKNKSLLKLVSKQNVSCAKLSNRVTYNNLVVKYKYICPNCTSMYTHASKLLQHLKQKHNSEHIAIPEKSIKLQCPFCKKLLVKNYNKHVMVCSVLKHSNKDKNKVHGLNEIKGNISEENIKSHKTSKLTKYKHYCAVCDTSLSTEYAARQHRQQIHPELKYRHIIKRTKIGDKVDKENKSEMKRSDKSQRSTLHDEPRTSVVLDTEEDDEEYPSTDELYESNTSSEGENSASDSISMTDISSQNTTSSERSWKPSTNQNASCNEDENNCDSDESTVYSYESHETSETSDSENNDICDKNKTKTMNASEKGTSTDSNGSHGAGNRRKYMFKCLICNTILYSDYASRKHRANQHPKMRGVPIFSKIKKVELDGNEQKSNRLNRETNKKFLDNTSSLTDSVADVEQGNNKKDDKVSKRCKNNIRRNASDSNWSTVSNLDRTTARSTRTPHNSGHCAVNTDIEASSEDSNLGSCNEDETANKDKHSTTVRKRSNTKRRKRAVTIKKRTANEESSDSDWIISTDESVDCFNDMKNSDICDRRDTDKSNDGSFLSIDEEALPRSDDETIKSSTFTVRKRRERLSKLFGDENDSDGEGCDKRVISKEHANKSLEIRDHSDNQCDSHKRNPLTCENEVLSDRTDDETIKVSEHTIKKRKERISIMFDDGIQEERNGGLNQSSNHVSTVKNNGCNVDISKNNEDRYETTSERSEFKEGEYNPGQCEEVRDQQVQNKETCCKTSEDCAMDPATDQSSSTKNSDENNTSNNANATLNHDDRIEIDLIDGLLEEYNSQTPDDQQSNSRVEKEKYGKDDREPNISDAQSSEANINIQASLPAGKITNCFENIQITNVRSIANKLLIFICLECSFATDTYDDTIRHSQNHYNHIEDPVTYCNICQVNYDTFCFNRHQTWHDKYLINMKIKFSFHWLFSNWHKLFENKNIPLRESEEIQVKSIYKTHCIKMSVKEAGPWQSALYLCAKCNTCVSPRDIEKHMQNSCTSKNYPCTQCDRAFLTHEMLEHHKIYHQDGIIQQFKTIVFNEENDKSFNIKLIQAKSQLFKNKQHQRNADIYKCMCGLCFISLKKFKLHFVDCDTQTNNGVKCTKCSGERRFLPTHLEEHFSLHHSVIKYVFKVQQITFQQECDYNSLELESVLKSTETITDNATQVRPDINTKKDMLNTDSLLHDNINIDEEDLEIINTAENAVRPICIDELLNIDRQILKDEPLSEHTNGENKEENIDIVEVDLDKRHTVQNEIQMSFNKELTINRNLSKDEPLSQSTSGEYAQEVVNVVVANTKNKSTTEKVTQATRNDKDLHVKKDMLKNESFSQNSNEENVQENVEENLQYEGIAVNVTQSAIDKDINIKKDMLKDESLSQGTIEENMQEEVDIFEANLEISAEESVAPATGEELNIKRDMLKDESLSQGTIEEIMQEDIFQGNLETNTVESVALIATDEDFNIKREMLKDESFSQNSVEECTQENLDSVKEIFFNNSPAENAPIIVHIDEDLSVTDTTSMLQENNKGKKPDSPNASKQHLEIEREVSRNIDSGPIVIEDSEDDDVELIEEDLNELKFARRRAYSDSNNWELLL